MAGTNRLNARIDDEREEKLDSIGRSCNCENRTEAVETAIDIAHREAKNPIVHRWRDQVIDWCGNLGVFAVFSILLGFATPTLSPANGAVMAVGFAATAVCLLGLLELTRLVSGQSELSIQMRELIAKIRA